MGVRDDALESDVATGRLPEPTDATGLLPDAQAAQDAPDAPRPTGRVDVPDLPDLPDLLELDLADLRTIQHPVLTEVLEELRERAGRPSEMLWGFNNAF
ncbi:MULTISPECIES: FxSxx-COOH cyclophane-containing RiPP peptide [unclassified Streptomyces]|uniref:FxSxx-COOH cyclophane-containing RiPP peptide n=1 Tax=unclassified Streptomyces TaxID=2593676 RepID=UPI0036513E26